VRGAKAGARTENCRNGKTNDGVHRPGVSVGKGGKGGLELKETGGSIVRKKKERP